MSTIFQGKTTRDLVRRVKTDGLGVTSVPDGVEEITYTADVDFHALAVMARTAAKSKGQKCKDGALSVKVIRRKRI